MHDLRDLADRIERLVLRHEELKRTNALLTQEVAVLTAERDGLRSRLTAARARIDALLERLPHETTDAGESGMKQVEVTILGQGYILGCPEGGDGLLQSAVQSVDREMVAIRDGGKVKARERIAVLAALNLAYRLAEQPSGAGGTSAQAMANEEIEALVRRLDTVLGSDGHLI